MKDSGHSFSLAELQPTSLEICRLDGHVFTEVPLPLPSSLQQNAVSQEVGICIFLVNCRKKIINVDIEKDGGQCRSLKVAIS